MRVIHPTIHERYLLEKEIDRLERENAHLRETLERAADTIVVLRAGVDSHDVALRSA